MSLMKRLHLSRITIYHPSKYLGGTEVLFSRVIELILSQGCQELCVIDYKDGILASKFRNSAVKYYDVEDDNRRYLLEGALLIASARNINRVIDICLANKVNVIRPFFWLLHPSELYSGYCLGSSGIKKRYGYSALKYYLNILPGFIKFKKDVLFLNNNRNLWIMDEACLAESDWAFDLCLNKASILPLITNLDCNYDTVKLEKINSSTSTFRLLVLSRLDDFKIYGIIKLINDLSLYNSENRCFELHIVGDGTGKEFLQSLCSNISNIKAIFHGYIENSHLNNVFSEYDYDLFFAMGTSALEGACRGIPTVLLPSSDKPIVNRNDVYKFLAKQSSKALGEYLDTPFEIRNGSELSEIIRLSDSHWRELSVDTIRFFKNIYSKHSTINNFLEALQLTNSIHPAKMKKNIISSIYLKCLTFKRKRAGV